MFSDPSSGEQHGYRDSWRDDGCFHYTGEGKYGDQEMKRGNRSILDAEKVGRALRVFKGAGDEVQYRGRFYLDVALPFYTDDAPESGTGRTRSVIVFRLRPADALPEPATGLPAPNGQTVVLNVPVEEMNTERMMVDPAREPFEAERRESALVQKFKSYMIGVHHAVERLQITPAGEAKPIFTDVYLRDLNILVEAKGGIDRSSIRMAIGQLMDYRRFVKAQSVRCAVLLPEVPRPDLLELLAYAGVLVYLPEKGEFVLMDGAGSRVSV